MDESKLGTLDVAVHRRILKFLNAARSPEELMTPPPVEILLVDDRVMAGDVIAHQDEHHDEIRDSHGHPGAKRKRPRVEHVFSRELAKRILRARDDYNPIAGFRHISQLEKIAGIDRAILDRLIKLFSPRFRGKWEVMYADSH